MQRIALVTDWFAPRRGGMEAQLADLAAGLADAGAEVCVMTATPGDRGPPSGAYAVTRLNVRTLPSPPLAIAPDIIPRIREALSRGWDMVHVHVSVVSPVGWTGAFVARSLGLPVAVTFHSVLRAKAALLRLASAVTPLGSARIAWSAVSRMVANQARWGLGDGPEVAVLPNGIHLDRWITARQRVLGDRLTLVSAMRLHRKKRGRQLLRAFAGAARQSPVAVRLIVVGDGPERDALQRDLVDLGLQSGPAIAEIRGWLSASELRDLYATADGFVMPSIHESFGIAALEARAAGLPVIARRSGSSEFLVDGRNALLADNDAELSRALGAFMRDPACRARLRASVDDLSRFGWASVIAAHQREYDKASRLASTSAPAAAASA